MLLHELILGDALTSQVAWQFIAGLLILPLSFYGWLAVRSSRKAVLTTQEFGTPDIFWAAIIGLFYLSMILMSLHAPSDQKITMQAIIASCMLNGALILGIFGVIGFQKHSAIARFGLQPSRFPQAARTGLLWLACILPLILLVGAVAQHFVTDKDDSQQIVRYFVDHPGLKDRVAVIFMAVIVAPVTEEIIFRGYFYGILRRYAGRIPALLISSALFTAIHMNLSATPGLFILALTLCLLYERTGSLWATMTLHASFNLVSVIGLILYPQLNS